MTKIVKKDGSGAVTKTVEYAYDVFDRRVEKTVAPVSGPAEVEHFVYDGAHVALRFENGSLSNRHLHGPAVDQILADEQVSDLSAPGEVLWPLADNLGTVRDLVRYDAAAMKTHHGIRPDFKHAFELAYHYIRSRARHMRYAEFKSRNLPIGSGVTEAACKNDLYATPEAFGNELGKAGGCNCLAPLRDPLEWRLGRNV